MQSGGLLNGGSLMSHVFLPDYLAVMADVQDCSNILTAICERWDDARSSCEIFSRLSISAFRELMKATNQGQEMNATLQQQTSVTNANMPSTIDAGAFYSTMAHGDVRDHQDGHVPIFPSNGFQVGNVMGFQDLFRDMQSSLHEGGFNGPNEVIMGLDREWFE